MSRPYLSLFSGCGGLDIGFEAEGFELGLAFDIRKQAIASLNANRPTKKGHVFDVRNLRLNDLDELHGGTFEPSGVIGGPPCQSFSRANRSKVAEDARADMINVFVDKVVETHKRHPLDFVVMENVPELRNFAAGEPFKKIVSRLRRAGFQVRHFVVDSQNFSVPQRRRRLFIVGIRSDALAAWQNISDFETPPVTVRDALEHLTEPVRFADSANLHTVREHPNHWCMTPRSAKFSAETLKPGTSFGRSFRTLKWDGPSATVSFGHREVHVHPSGKRRLSVYESMLLQGFPQHYHLKGTLSDQFSQVSEAVSPPVASAVAKFVRMSLK